MLLDLVKERPCLYDKQLSDHSDQLVLENSMEEIAFIMQDSGNEIKLFMKLRYY